jgi:hypothetical protein
MWEGGLRLKSIEDSMGRKERNGLETEDSGMERDLLIGFISKTSWSAKWSAGL